MRLKPLDSPELLRLVAGWLSEKENYQWLDFGDGRQILTPEWLKIMSQRKSEVLRVYTRDDDDAPVGIVALSNVDQKFKTARGWVVTGDKSFRARGHATRASAEILAYGFEQLGLHTLHTWIAEGNPSIKIMDRLGFKFIGRQRQCHYMDGRFVDRLWFDLLEAELKQATARLERARAAGESEGPSKVEPHGSPQIKGT